MPEIRAAVEAATERIHELAEEIAKVHVLLQEEQRLRIEDKEDAERREERVAEKVRRSHRRIIVSIVGVAASVAVAVGALSWVLRTEERDRCETSNEVRRGTRVIMAIVSEGDQEVADILYDESAAAPRNQGVPGAQQYIEGRRAVAAERLEVRAEEIQKLLDETQPIRDC
jgi:hypothetical protein